VITIPIVMLIIVVIANPFSSPAVENVSGIMLTKLVMKAATITRNAFLILFLTVVSSFFRSPFSISSVIIIWSFRHVPMLAIIPAIAGKSSVIFIIDEMPSVLITSIITIDIIGSDTLKFLYLSPITRATVIIAVMNTVAMLLANPSPIAGDSDSILAIVSFTGRLLDCSIACSFLISSWASFIVALMPVILALVSTSPFTLSGSLSEPSCISSPSSDNSRFDSR